MRILRLHTIHKIFIHIAIVLRIIIQIQKREILRHATLQIPNPVMRLLHRLPDPLNILDLVHVVLIQFILHKVHDFFLELAFHDFFILLLVACFVLFLDLLCIFCGVLISCFDLYFF